MRMERQGARIFGRVRLDVLLQVFDSDTNCGSKPDGGDVAPFHEEIGERCADPQQGGDLSAFQQL